MTDSLAQVAKAIADALHDRDLPVARGHFDRAVQGRQVVLGALVKRLAESVEVPEGTIVVGFGIDVWGNPHRYDYAWRCGDCPWTGSNYTTSRAARRAAEKHAEEHHSTRRALPAVTGAS